MDILEKIAWVLNLIYYTNLQKDERGFDFEAVTTDNQCLGSVHFDPIQNKLHLVNKFTSLHKRILLLGYSKKSQKREVIGQFGEGLKIGALALVREGRTVSMETGNDRWYRSMHISNKKSGELM